MNISTKLEDEKIDPEKPSGGYEWWYFDALSTDKEWGIVVIFYDGNPFSTKYIDELGKNPGSHAALPKQFPAISVSLYRKGKAEYYSFLEYGEGKFHWDDEEQTGSVGSNFFKRNIVGDKLEYELLLTQTLESGHSINAKLKFVSQKLPEDLLSHESAGEKHFWNLIQPKARVTGSITVEGKRIDRNILFNGDGYHDHNTGFEPMKDSFKDWYWGRFHFRDATLIYYVMNGLDGSQQHEAWLFDSKSQELLEKFDQIELDYPMSNRFGLNTYRKLEIISPTTEITIQQNRLIDNGPFYQRFVSDAIMKREESVSPGQGISEYIKPEIIYEEKYWWMVKMRLRFVEEKPHWVQRSKMFYQWTW